MKTQPLFVKLCRTFAIAVTLLGLLSACSTMTPAQCKVADWYDVGLRDGLAGEPLTQLEQRDKDCAEAGVRANAQLYLQGRERGLATYCRLDNAVRLGLDGKRYQGVCSPAIDAEFRRRFDIGKEVYQARADLRNQESRRSGLEDKLRKAATDDERRRVRDELSDLDRSMRRARDRLWDAERALGKIY